MSNSKENPQKNHISTKTTNKKSSQRTLTYRTVTGCIFHTWLVFLWQEPFMTYFLPFWGEKKIYVIIISARVYTCVCMHAHVCIVCVCVYTQMHTHTLWVSLPTLFWSPHLSLVELQLSSYVRLAGHWAARVHLPQPPDCRHHACPITWWLGSELGPGLHSKLFTEP